MNTLGVISCVVLLAYMVVGSYAVLTTVPALCGNSVLNPGETCDQGPQNNQRTACCNNLCQPISLQIAPGTGIPDGYNKPKRADVFYNWEDHNVTLVSLMSVINPVKINGAVAQIPTSAWKSASFAYDEHRGPCAYPPVMHSDGANSYLTFPAMPKNLQERNVYLCNIKVTLDLVCGQSLTKGYVFKRNDIWPQQPLP